MIMCSQMNYVDNMPNNSNILFIYQQSTNKYLQRPLKEGRLFPLPLNFMNEKIGKHDSVLNSLSFSSQTLSFQRSVEYEYNLVKSLECTQAIMSFWKIHKVWYVAEYKESNQSIANTSYWITVFSSV